MCFLLTAFVAIWILLMAGNSSIGIMALRNQEKTRTDSAGNARRTCMGERSCKLGAISWSADSIGMLRLVRARAGRRRCQTPWRSGRSDVMATSTSIPTPMFAKASTVGRSTVAKKKARIRAGPFVLLASRALSTINGSVRRCFGPHTDSNCPGSKECVLSQLPSYRCSLRYLKLYLLPWHAYHGSPVVSPISKLTSTARRRTIDPPAHRGRLAR